MRQINVIFLGGKSVAVYIPVNIRMIILLAIEIINVNILKNIIIYNFKMAISFDKFGSLR